MLNALTIDMEEWFCVSNYEHLISRAEWPRFESRIEAPTHIILELLEKHQVKATFFFLGWIAERHPELVATVASNGHEIASHGYDHRLNWTLTAEEFREDLSKSLRILNAVGDTKCLGYRAPSFSLRREMTWAWEALADHGLLYDSSIYPAAHSRCGRGFSPATRKRSPAQTATRTTAWLCERQG